MDTITIKGMHFYGYHGCLPEEQRTGQPFHVDAVLYADLSKAGASDELNDTIDYSRVYQLVQSIVEGRTYHSSSGWLRSLPTRCWPAFPSTPCASPYTSRRPLLAAPLTTWR